MALCWLTLHFTVWESRSLGGFQSSTIVWPVRCTENYWGSETDLLWPFKAACGFLRSVLFPLRVVLTLWRVLFLLHQQTHTSVSFNGLVCSGFNISWSLWQGCLVTGNINTGIFWVTHLACSEPGIHLELMCLPGQRTVASSFLDGDGLSVVTGIIYQYIYLRKRSTFILLPLQSRVFCSLVLM